MLTSFFEPCRQHGEPIRKPIRDDRGLRDLAPAAVLLVAGLLGLIVASLSAGERNGQYLVIAAPWSGFGQTMRLIMAAEGSFIEAGSFGNIAIAASAHPDFETHARNAGAWLVFPSPRLAGCLGLSTRTSEQ
jgi:hypothetical protein